MRIWDLDPALLCRKHLLGEHRELHGLWNIYVKGKQGYRNHPETIRWEGKLGALRLRHEALVAEMERRGWNHKSPLGEPPHGHSGVQLVFVNTIEEQIELLRNKGCDCKV
jgi:hypothetical protein